VPKIYVLSGQEVAGASNLPVINIEYLSPKIDFDAFDAIIFTSKNGVKALDAISKEWRGKPSLVIGKATAEAVKQCRGRLSFCSDESYAEALSQEILKKFRSLVFLYARPTEVVFDIAEFLRAKGIKVEDKIVYHTTCSKEELEAPEAGSVIIFSSPSTVKCFFARFAWDTRWRAVAIGKTTASFIPQEISFELSKEQNLASAVEIAKELLAL
jgi:uroporphyrinogen-III synthase